jgi:DNA-binding winged helix-turn-helix (wHTH) protein
MTFSDLTLDPVTREVHRGSRSISLTRTEFALLEMLIANPRRVLTRSRILEEVWGFDFPTSGNALEVYVGYLRRKTEAEGEPRLIHTVRGVGYVLRETPPDVSIAAARPPRARAGQATTSLSLRWRVMLLAMSMVAMVVVLMAVAVYAVVSRRSTATSTTSCRAARSC